MRTLLERIGLEHPVVQAGMGGGIAGVPLAAAVSAAGGLGTLGTTLDPAEIAADLAAVRERTSRPVAVNLLLPFARRAHAEAARGADVLVTFWGRPRRPGPGVWLHQCGSVAEARAAVAAGADGVIAQGVEAGGHVRGTLPAIALLARIRATLPGTPVWLAGGLADAADVAVALASGADAAVLGTRFVMTAESGAHTAYKQRLMETRETVLTELFGLGWANAPHRVAWNHATERWLTRNRRGPGWVRALEAATAPASRRLPAAAQVRALRAQRPAVPFFSPLPCVRGLPSRLLDATPIYAGMSVARIHDLRPAGELVAALAGG